MAYNSIVL